MKNPLMIRKSQSRFRTNGKIFQELTRHFVSPIRKNENTENTCNSSNLYDFLGEFERFQFSYWPSGM